jgi:hypothetical protein
MAGPEGDGQNHDPGTRLVLEELRDLRLEMRADRQHASEERRRADEERRRTDEEWRLERRQADEQWRQERLRSDERFQELMRDFREDSARREATTQKAFKDIRAVGLSIVKTLNHHTRILERIERKLGTGGSRRPGQGNGRGA